MSHSDSISRNVLSSKAPLEIGSQYNASTAKNSERTPLLNSVGMSESLVNKNVSDMEPGVSWGVAAFLLVNTALGAGMLNYPYAYSQIGGVLAAALMQVVLLVFITSTMFILVYCADFNQDDTYHDVLLSMCGKRAQQISAMSILFTCYGINITFLVIIGDQYDRIFNSLLAEYVQDYWYLDRKFTITISAVLFIWPMCYAKRLDFLKYASFLGMFAMVYVAFLTVYEHYKLDRADIANELAQHGFGLSTDTNATNSSALNHNVSTKQTRPNQLLGSLIIVPVLCFAYQTHEVIVPVYACMKQRVIGHFMKASIFGLVILFFLYNLVGAYGYLTFGDNVGPDIMSLYDAKDPVVIVGIVALVIKFITTYPPLMFCGRGALDGLYGEMRKLSAEEFKASERMRRIIISTLWFVSTVVFAAFAPDISLTLQLLGSMASINVFIFPGMCLVSLTRRLRRARLSFLVDESYEHQPGEQRAKDYYLISGSYFGKMKKNALRAEALANQQYATNGSTRHQYAATFASLLDFEQTTSGRMNDYSTMNGNGSQSKHVMNGYGSQSRHQKRQEEFERLMTTGSLSLGASQDQGSNIRRPINDSYEDYSDCDECCKHKCDMISSYGVYNSPANRTYVAANKLTGAGATFAFDSDLNISSGNHNKDQSSTNERSARLANNGYNNHKNHRDDNQEQHLHQCYQSSCNNMRSTTGSILDRLGTSIAPSTVGQIGISPATAMGLYIFSALLITFGAFIFVLELANVFGLM